MPFLLLGVAPEVIAVYALLYSVNGFFQHCNARVRYGFLNYLVASAETHRWHHARDPKTASCNFGHTTIIWDLLFGTWYLPRNEMPDIGIMDRSYPQGFCAQMLAPFRRKSTALDGQSRDQGRDQGKNQGRDMSSTMKNRFANLVLDLALMPKNWLHRAQLARAIRDPMKTQRAVLARILRINRDTRFGRKYDFASINDERRYRERVPVHDYEALRPYVDAHIDSGERALTHEAPAYYLRTSGTTGRAKDIPRSIAAIGRPSLAASSRSPAPQPKGTSRTAVRLDRHPPWCPAVRRHWCVINLSCRSRSAASLTAD